MKRKQRARLGFRDQVCSETLEKRILLSKPQAGAAFPPPIDLPYEPPQYRLFNQRGSHYLSKPARGTALEIALKFLSNNAAKLGATAADFANPVITDQYTDDSTGITHIYLRQQFNGLEVANADFSINITRDGRVLSAGGGFIPNLAAQVSASKTLAHIRPTVNAVQAVSSAALGLGLKLTRPIVVKSAAATAPDRGSVLEAGDISLEDVPAKLQYVATATGVKVAWNLVIRTRDNQHWFEINVDGVSGAPLASVDWMQSANDFAATSPANSSLGQSKSSDAPAAAPLPAPATGDGSSYNVFPAPFEGPADGSRQIVTNPADPAYSPFGWHDTNGTAGAEFTDTRGNNVWAQEDVDHNDTGGLRPEGTSSLTFNFPLDLTKAPSANQNAAITNLFYWTNLLHDVHANYGFTEAAGNFQVTNYTGQGLGGDAVFADAQDGSALDTSSFATPPDGQSPRLQMYLFDQTTPARDGDFDSQLIVREYGHGVSTRLTGGPANSNSLAAIQSAAMGEGWSDWWALMFTLKVTDTQAARYPIGTYALGQNPAGGNGLRQYPYSYDLAVDPLSYKAIKTNSESHSAGAIWASALWDLNWLLIDKYGFDSNWSHGYSASDPSRNGGNNLAMKLIMDALKLQPSNPSFLAGRDAILAADVALNGGLDAQQIWAAFARRGMGLSASDGGSPNSTNVSEGFDVPAIYRDPSITSQSPSFGAVLTAPPARLDLTFSEPMDPTSFSVAADVLSFTSADGVEHKGQITGFGWLNNDTTLRLVFSPQTSDGEYRIILGPGILAADDHSPMDQNRDGTGGNDPQDEYTAKFRYDSLVLAVSSTSPANNAIVTLPMTALDLNFNEAIDPASVDKSDISISRGSVTDAVALDSDTIRYTLSGIAGETNLTFSLGSGSITDVFGNPNAAYSGTFSIDNSDVPFSGAFGPVPSDGSFVFQGTASTNLTFVGDVDTFNLDLEGGQTLRALLTPATGMQAKIELFSPQGTLLCSASAGALTPVADIAVAGTYKLAVTLLGGSAGTARVTVNLNAATEADPGTAGVAQDLNSAFRPIFAGSPADRVTLVGAAVGGSTDAQDLYSFDLIAGQSVSIVWSGSSTLAPALNLLAPDGTLLAASASNTASMPSTISDFIAPVTGTYVLGFGLKNNVTYSLAITRDAAMEVEPNDTAATANPIASRSISGSRFVVGNLSAGATDYFTVRAKAGDVLTFQSSTPGDAPNQPPNILDPKLLLFGSDGAQIASNDNSAPDGRNARLTYTATADATLFMQLTGASASTTGNYALEVAGATAPTTAPFLTVTSPTSGTRLNVSPGTVNVTFSQAIRVDTLSASDLLVDGTPATAVTISGSNLLSFTIPTGLAEGNHTIAMAPGTLSDIHGNPSAALSSGFVIDKTGPRIISTSIQKDMVIPTLTDVVFKIKFDEALDLRFFVLDNYSDYSLKNSTADGVPADGGAWTYDTPTNTLTITYPTPSDGNYVFTLFSGGNGIVDLAGNGLDGETPLWPIPTNRSGDGVSGGNFVTNFRIDSVTTPFPALSQVGMPGSQMYTGQVSLNLDSATDVDSFTLNLDAGQILSISDSPSSGELRPQLQVRDPSGTIIGGASGPYNQSGAAINAIPINVSGTYTITGSVYNNAAGSIGTSIMTVVLNATFGSQLRWPHGGSPTPEPITFVPLGSEPNRFVGSVFSRSQDQSSDPYVFTLGAGDTASLAYDGTFSGIDFYLLNGNNTTYITSGNALSNQTSSAQSYLAVVRGIRVDSSINPDYELTIFKNADFDTEPGNDHASANVLRSKIIAGEQAAAGYIDAGDVDSYVVPVLAGQTITLQTSTPGDGPGRFDNALNPKLALYSAGGALLVGDDNSATDGHNARIVYTPTATATLYLDVLSTPSVATQGEYVLSITNAVHLTTTFNATINVPSRTNAPPNSVGVSFDGAVDLSSVQASDLLLDGVPAVSFSDNGTYGLSFTFSNSISAGTHTFTLSSGAIRDLYQTPVQSTSATFSLDTTAPRIINSTIQKGDELPSGGITVTLTFDEPIDVSLIDSTAVTLHGVSYAGGYAPASLNFDSTGKILTLNFSKLLEDSYTLTLLSSRFQDLVGNALDGETTAAAWPMPPNRSGNGAAGGDFTVDFGVDQSGTSALLPLAADGRLGSLVYRTFTSGVLDRAADTDTFTLSLEAGLPLTVRLTANGFASSLTILDPSQNSIGTFTAVSSGQPALAQNITLTVGGTYSFIVASTTAIANSGLYTVEVIADAKLESESNGGASNNTQATAQTLTLSPITGAASVPVLGGALYGSFETSAIDFYALNLSAGDRMSAVVTTPTAANVVLTLLDSTGLSLTSSTSGGSGLSASIASFSIPSSGIYYLKATGNAGNTYQLAVNTGALFEIEPNDTPAKAQILSPVQRVLGSITSGTTLVSPFSEGFELGLPLGPAWSTYSSRPQGQIQVTSAQGAAAGTYALVMDNGADDSVFTLNEATFTIDLSGQTGAALSFAEANFGDERQAMTADFADHFAGDGVAISTDGVHWHPVWTPPASETAGWTVYTIDVAAEAAKAQMQLGANLRIRFQQYDDRSLAGGDGRGYDAIVVSGLVPNADYYAVDLSAGDAIALRTFTPFDQPNQPLNTLDPRLDLYSPTGNLLASDNNSAADARNAVLQFTAPASGRYLLRVSASTLGLGDYLLDTSFGSSNTPAQPDLVSTSDTGVSASDHLTSKNNSTSARALQFSVAGVAAGATVTLLIDAIPVASTVSPGSSVTLTTDGTTALADGTYLITVRQQLAGQGLSLESIPLSLTIDTAAPATPVLPQLQPTSDTQLAGDNITTIHTPIFNVFAAASPYFRAYINGIRSGGDFLSGTVFTAPLLPDGNYALTTASVDAAGNESPQSPPVSFRLVTSVPPDPTVKIDLADASDSGVSNSDNITNLSSPTLLLPAGLVGFRVFVNGVATTASMLTGTTYVLPQRADGNWDLTYTAFDQFGTESGISPKLTITIDTVAPAAPKAPDLNTQSDTGDTNNDNITNDNTPNFTISTGPYVRLFRNGFLVSSLYDTVSITTSALPDGTADYVVRNLDAAGNESPDSPALSVTIDTVAPAAPLIPLDLVNSVDTGVSDTDNITQAKSLAFNVPVGTHDARFYKNGVSQFFFRDPLATVSAAAEITDGIFTWSYSIMDVAGNTSPQGVPLVVTIDSTASSPPTIDLLASSDTGISSTDNITADNTPTFGITSSDPYFRFFQNDVLLSGLWETGTSFTSLQLPDGTNSFYFVSVDAAGNSLGEGNTLSVTVDATAPSSTVGTLPATSAAGSIALAWSGQDNMTGIVSYDLYVSDNGGPFTAFLSATTQTSGNYNGVAGHTYRFYSTARDRAGNLESSPPAPDATTTIPPIPAALSVKFNSGSPIAITPSVDYLSIRLLGSVQASLSLADLRVRSLTLAQDIVPSTLQYDLASNTAVITFAPGLLSDGNYNLTLFSAGITDVFGVPLDGNGDGLPGGDFVFSFFKLTGDADLDHDVDQDDLNIVSSALGSRGVRRADGDANDDHTVDFQDLVAVAQHYGATGTTLSTGDFNDDGTTGFADLVAVAQNYGRNGKADLNRDGIVDQRDLALVNGNLGKSLPAPAGVLTVPAEVQVPVISIPVPKQEREPAPGGSKTAATKPPSRLTGFSVVRVTREK